MLDLSEDQRAIAAGLSGEGAALAMRIVTDAAQLLGAERLVPVASSHIDGALYHGDSGTLFAEELVRRGAKTAIRATLNVGALDLMGCSRQRLPAHERDMAKRLMTAYVALGCEPSFTCAPYQAGHRPALGSDVAWGESNAVAFCNSVLGARTNRYGDFLDIACAIAGAAPYTGLHQPRNRLASLVLDVSGLPEDLRRSDAFYPVIGTLLGREVGTAIGLIDGLQGLAKEDGLKALGAAAASAGGVGLFHVAGVTPEAPDVATATGGLDSVRTLTVTPAIIRATRDRLSTIAGDRLDAVAIGSPHLSLDEVRHLAARLAGRRLAVTLYANTGRHVLKALEADGSRAALEAQGVAFVIDTCIVVTPILPELTGGVLMTNSGKFAHYAPGNTGYGVIFGALDECIESAVAGRITRDEMIWGGAA